MPSCEQHRMRKPPEPQGVILRGEMSRVLSEELGHPVFTLDAEITGCIACHEVNLTYPNGDSATRIIAESEAWTPFW